MDDETKMEDWQALEGPLTLAERMALLAAAEWFSAAPITEPFSGRRCAAHLARMAAGKITLSGHRSPATYEAYDATTPLSMADDISRRLRKALQDCYLLVHRAWNDDRFGSSNESEAKDLRRELDAILAGVGVPNPLGLR